MIEKEIKRLLSNGGLTSPGTLAIAVSKMNNRVRSNDLSAIEVLSKRDNFTNEALHFDDKDIGRYQYEKRLQNHHSSEKSKSSGTSPSLISKVSAGYIVNVTSEGSKHRAREFYLVTQLTMQLMQCTFESFAEIHCGKSSI